MNLIIKVKTKREERYLHWFNKKAFSGDIVLMIDNIEKP